MNQARMEWPALLLPFSSLVTMSHNVCKRRDGHGCGARITLRAEHGVTIQQGRSPGMVLAGSKNGHFTRKDDCKQHDRAGAWSWSGMWIMGLLSILGAACTLLPAPKKKDGKTFIYCCPGAWVQALGHGKNLILNLERGIFLLFHGFFRFSVLLTAATTFRVTFPLNPAPLHPFLIKYLFLQVFNWVQRGCKGGCRLGAARVQVQGFFLTCTQTK